MSTTITVHKDHTGNPRVVWDMDAEVADSIMTLMARECLARQRATESRVDPTALGFLDPLYAAVSAAYDLAEHTGCPDLWPDAPAMPLAEPALLGSVTGDMLAVLVPGQTDPYQAVAIAVETARDGGYDIDAHDESLVAEVSPARWMVLNKCESTDHDFHPELAAHGPRTAGAVLVTRVDLTLT